MKEIKKRVKRKPTTVEALSGLMFLLAIIVVGNVWLGLSVELMFILATFFVGGIGWRCGFTYKEMKDGMIRSVADNAEMLCIMLGIGFVIGSWVFSGTVPVMIAWLAELISVQYVLVLSFLFCGIIAAIIGTSSATMGTIGVIMLSVATVQGVPPGIAAASVICGSFIGQVTSMLADMVNYNAALTGNTPQSLIRMCLPAESVGILVSAGFFFLAGMRMETSSDPNAMGSIDLLVENVFLGFKSSPIVLIPIAVLFLLVLKKVDVVPTLFLAGLSALAVGLFYQGFSIQDAFQAAYSGFKPSMLTIPEGTPLMEEFTSLVTRGGMYSMSDFLISIPIMMAYCGMLATTGSAEVASQALFREVKKPGNAIAANTLSALFLCASTGSVMAPGVLGSKMFSGIYEKVGLSRKNLAVSYQFACTMGALLFPWCAVTVYAQSVIKVPSVEWVPYLTLVYIPILAHIVFGYLGIGVVKLESDRADSRTEEQLAGSEQSVEGQRAESEQFEEGKLAGSEQFEEGIMPVEE